MISKLRSRIGLDDHIAQLDELINTLISRVDALENRLNGAVVIFYGNNVNGDFSEANVTTVETSDEKGEDLMSQREKLTELYRNGAISAPVFMREFDALTEQINSTNQALI